MVCIEGYLPEGTCCTGAAGGAGNQDLCSSEEGQKERQRALGVESGGGAAQLHIRLFKPQKDKGYKDPRHPLPQICDGGGCRWTEETSICP